MRCWLRLVNAFPQGSPIHAAASPMKVAPESIDEPQRLAALRRYQIIDTPPETVFDRITSLVARLFGVPIVLISLVEEQREWFKSCYGLDAKQLGREVAFCAHAILADEVTVVTDARKDRRFADNPLVTGEPFIRFYAGAPLTTRDHQNIGALAIIDTEPRELSIVDRATLADLAALVVDEFELRLAGRRIAAEAEARRRTEEFLAEAQHLAGLGSWEWDLKTDICAWSDEFYRIHGLAPQDHIMTAAEVAERTHPDDRQAVREFLARATADRLPFAFDKRIIREDGAIRLLEMKAAVSRMAEDQVECVTGTAQDVTELRAAQKTLRDAQAELEQRVELRTAALSATNEELKREINERELLQRLTHAIHEARDLPASLETVLRHACKANEWDVAEAWVPREDGSTLSCHTGWYGETEATLNFKRCSENINLVPGQGLAGRVWQRGEIEWIADLNLASASEFFGRLEEARAAGLRTALAIPVKAEGETLAVMIFYSVNLCEQTSRPTAVMEAIATQLGSIFRRKQAEVELRHREREFRALVENSPDVITRVDRTFRYLYASPAIERFVGLPPAVFVTKTSRERGDPEELVSEWEGKVTHVFETGEEALIEFDFPCADGRTRRFESRLIPELDGAGAIESIMTVSRDLTERRQAEAALDESRRRLQALFDNSADSFFLYDDEARLVDANPAAVALLGYSRAELLGEPLIKFVHDPANFKSRWLRFSQLGRTSGEAVLQRKDGSSVPVEFHATRSIVTGLHLSILRDISERRTAEHALRQSEAIFRATIAASPDVITVLAPNGRLILNSRSTAKLFGLPAVDWDGCDVFELIREIVHPDDRETHAGVIQAMLAGDKEEGESHYRVLNAAGHWITLESRFRVMTGVAGELSGIVVDTRDVTERIEFEKKLEQAKQAAEAANVAKSEFLSRMSHELRTPLNAILGFGQLLEGAVTAPDDLESAQQVLKGGRHLLELINEVLDISRIEAGHLDLSLQPVEVMSVIRESVALVQPLASGSDVRFLPALDCPFHVLADRQRLQQVLINLISNAIKYNRAGGSVEVTCAAVGQDRVRISVIDTGIGIPHAKFDQLFVAFERLGAEQGLIEGTGLGLAVSKRLIEAMGGRIGMESANGEGSVFWIELPAADSLPTPTPEMTAPTQLRAREPVVDELRTVLLIEDNLSNLRLMERLLKRRPSVELIFASTGAAGLKLALERRPDLLLLDLNLPDIDGEEVLRRLRAEPAGAEIPVIVISADATLLQIERLRGAGAADYLTKPIDVKQFFETVDQVLTAPS